MDYKERILLERKRNVNSVDIDKHLGVELQANESINTEYNVIGGINASDLFEEERESVESYRIYGTINYLSLLNNIPNDYSHISDFFIKKEEGTNRKNFIDSFDIYLVRPNDTFDYFNNNLYYKYFKILATPKDINIRKMGYQKSIFNEVVFYFDFNLDFDIKNLKDGLGFPITEFFLYLKYKPIGDEVLSYPDLTTPLFPEISSEDDHNKPTYPLIDNLEITGEVGDILEDSENEKKICCVVELDKRNYTQRIKYKHTHLITTNIINVDEETSGTFQFYYNPLIKIKLRYLSNAISLANRNTTSKEQKELIPNHAIDLDTDGNIIWREILPDGVFDFTTNEGVDHPFVNGKKYVFNNIIFECMSNLGQELGDDISEEDGEMVIPAPSESNGDLTLQAFDEILFDDPKIININPINKEKILVSEEDINLQINLNAGFKINNQKEIVDNYARKKSEELINPLIDREIKNFKYKILTENGLIQNTRFEMNFFAPLKGGLDGNFINAGYTQKEINEYSISLRNSFFILEFYDGFEFNSRTKILTQYFTKLNEIIKNWNHTFIEDVNQLKILGIPRFFIKNKQKETLYLRILFYNAKTGGIVPFSNNSYDGDNEEEKQFFKIQLDIKNETWSLYDNSIEGVEIVSQSLKDRLGRTNETLRMKSQSHPDGSRFNYKTGEYEDAQIITPPPPPPDVETEEININILFMRNGTTFFGPSDDRIFTMRELGTRLRLIQANQVIQTKILTNNEFSFEDNFVFDGVYNNYTVDINNVSNNRIQLRYKDPNNGNWYNIKGRVECSLDGTTFTDGSSLSFTLEEGVPVNLYFRIIPLYILNATAEIDGYVGFEDDILITLDPDKYLYEYLEAFDITTEVKENPAHVTGYIWSTWYDVDGGGFPIGMIDGQQNNFGVQMEENNISIKAVWFPDIS